jgi:TldD protein
MVRLAKESVTQAQTNALGKFRDINLAPRNRVDNGHWVMPVKIDPFVVHPAEIMDCLSGLSNYIDRIPEFRVIQNVCSTYHQEKAFGASDGSYFTQCTYRTGGELKIEHKSGLRADVEGIQPSSIGWELYTDQPIRSYVDRTIEELREDSKLSIKPIDVGRYDTVLSAHAIGNIISGSIGAATELDRALGYEANAVGTSYLNEPLEMLGQYKLGTSLLNVSATRNSPGGLAWVRWDDEGVEPESFQLVKEGIVVGFQTTRESAAWLQSANSGSLRVPFKSSGCAVAPRADDAPLTHTPDLIIHPGTENIDYNDLVSSLPAGIAFSSLNVDMDFQQLNGFGNGGGRVYEIKNGKKVALLSGAGILFRSPEFWKKISMLGGEKGAQRIPCEGKKGQPRQVTYHSVMAVPCLVKELSIIDIKRKA